MKTNPVPRQNKTAKALLSILDAKEILRKDQELFYKTLSDLKSKLNSVSKKKHDDNSRPDEKGISET